jgi:hypothetical protein
MNPAGYQQRVAGLLLRHQRLPPWVGRGRQLDADHLLQDAILHGGIPFGLFPFIVMIYQFFNTGSQAGFAGDTGSGLILTAHSTPAISSPAPKSVIGSGHCLRKIKA